MAIKKGNSDITIFKGISEVDKVYKGTQEIFSKAPSVYSASISGLGNQDPTTVQFDVQDGLFSIIKEITFNGDVFIKFPKMYRKVNSTSSGQITSISIANAQIDSSYHIYPCFLDENGNELDYVLMGKYPCASSSWASSVVNPYYASMTINAGRNICRSRGTGYQQMDWMIFKLWQDLLIAKMKTVNTNSGSRIQTDQLGVFWSNNYTNYPWIDGVSWQKTSHKWLLSYKPSKYVNDPTSTTNGYVEAGYECDGSGECISVLGYDSANEFFNYPKTWVSNSSYNTYYCDQFSRDSGETLAISSSVPVAEAKYGAFAINGNQWYNSLHARLCYRPLSA